MSKYWALYGSKQTLIISALLAVGMILCVIAKPIRNVWAVIIGAPLALVMPGFLYRSVLQSIAKQKTNEEIGLFDFPYFKIALVSFLGVIVEMLCGGILIVINLIARFCIPVILAYLVIYTENTKNLKSIMDMAKRGLKFTFRKHFLTVLIMQIFYMIAMACLAVGIPVVDLVIPMEKLFFIPAVYFIALSGVYLMSKMIEYEENENSLSFENLDRWRTREIMGNGE